MIIARIWAKSNPKSKYINKQEKMQIAESIKT